MPSREIRFCLQAGPLPSAERAAYVQPKKHRKGKTASMEITIGLEKKARIQEGMIGLFFEDINYAADGGLYAEIR